MIGANLFAVLSDANLNEVMEFVRSGHVYGVIVSRRDGFSGEDLSFLNALPELRALLVNDEDGAPFRLTGIETLSGLKLLHIYSSRYFDISIMENLTELEELRFGEVKGQAFPKKIMPSVRSLYIDGYSGADLHSLSVFPGLTSLELTSPRRLENLDSLICFPALRELLLAYCPRLHDLSGLGFVPFLRKLNIDNAKNVADIVIPNALRLLEELIVTKSARLDHVDWVLHLGRLRHLVLMDVDICSGDLSPLRRLSSLEYLMIRPNKKHYNLDVAELMSDVSLRKNSGR